MVYLKVYRDEDIIHARRGVRNWKRGCLAQRSAGGQGVVFLLACSWMRAPQTDTGSRGRHHADPQTGEILGARPRINPLIRNSIQLHVNLLAGEAGGRVVVVVTAATIGLALTGLWVCWPLKIGWFRRGGNFRRFNLDLHSVAGLYTSAFLLVIAITGLTLHYLEGEHPKPTMSDPPPGPRTQITVDQAVALAEKALPGARAVSLQIASGYVLWWKRKER
jgi:uncharacterized iron-regulated membrane protein